MPQEKEVVFVYPNPYGYGERRLANIHNMPLAFLSMAAYLEKNGIPTRIIDTRAQDFRAYDFGKAAFVGITALSGAMIANGLTVARFIRDRHPRLPLAWGGVHPSLMPLQTIRHPLVDLVCQGEGERAALDLARAILEGKDFAGIPGLVTKDGATPPGPWMRLDDIPPLPYEKLDLCRYQNGTFFEFPTSRGCPHRCVFCYNLVHNWDPRTGHPSYRMQSAPHVVDQLGRVLARHPMQWAVFVEDNFFTSKRRVAEIAHAIVDKGWKFRWVTNGVASYFRSYDDDFLGLLKASGCTRIDIGGESGSAAILRTVGKGTSPEDMLISARKCARHGIIPSYSFLIGWPDESPKDIQATLDLVDTLVREVPSTFINGIYVVTPFPGTPHYQHAVDAGFVPPKDLEGWAGHLFAVGAEKLTPWLTPAQRRKLNVIARISKTDFIEGRSSRPFSGRAMNALHKLMSLDAQFRWKRRSFGAAPEWMLWDLAHRLRQKY